MKQHSLGIILALLILITLSGCNIAPKDDLDVIDSSFCYESYADTTGYLGMLKSDTGEYFLTYQDNLVYGLETIDFATNKSRESFKLNSNGANWYGAVYNNKLYYGVNSAIFSCDLHSGENKREFFYLDECKNIVVCGGGENTLLILMYCEKPTTKGLYLGKIFTYDLNNRESKLLCEPIGKYSHIRYLTSDTDYAYFGYFQTNGSIHSLDLKTGEFVDVVKDNTIQARRASYTPDLHSEINRFAIHENKLYFMVSGTEAGLYQLNIEQKTLEQIPPPDNESKIFAFTIDNGRLYTVVQHGSSGTYGYPGYFGDYSMYTVDIDTLSYDKISDGVEIYGEIRGVSVYKDKALVFGSNPTFIDLNK